MTAFQPPCILRYVLLVTCSLSCAHSKAIAKLPINSLMTAQLITSDQLMATTIAQIRTCCTCDTTFQCLCISSCHNLIPIEITLSSTCLLYCVKVPYPNQTLLVLPPIQVDCRLCPCHARK